MRQRMAIRHRAVVCLLEVLGGPDLIVELECLRIIERDRRRRDVGALVAGGLFERGQVDERLEYRSWLPPGGNHAIVLRPVVRPAADEGENLAGLGIDGDQCRFRPAAALAPRQQFVHARQAVAHGVLREPLQVQVERRHHIDGLVRLRREPGIVFGEGLADEVDEVGRLGFERALDDGQRLL